MLKDDYQNWMNIFGHKDQVDTVMMFRDDAPEEQLKGVLPKEN